MQLPVNRFIAQEEEEDFIFSSVGKGDLFLNNSSNHTYQEETLIQLKANVNKLSELQFRLQFMLGEIHNLILKK